MRPSHFAAFVLSDSERRFEEPSPKSNSHRFLSGCLEVLETAFWTFLIILLLVFVFVLMAVFMLYLVLKYPQIPASWFWPAIWTGMGLVVLGLVGLYFWWGGVLNDREELQNLFRL